MKRISKKVREEAAHFAQLVGSNDADGDSPNCGCSYCIRANSYVSAEAAQLASEATAFIRATLGRTDIEHYSEEYAEAEALLRTGWSPP